MNTAKSTATRIFLQTVVSKTKNINPHLPSGPVHPYQLEESISNFRGEWRTFSFLLYFEWIFLLANSEDPVLRRLIWVCTVCLCPKNGTVNT